MTDTDDEFDAAALAQGRRQFLTACTFVRGCVDIAGLPTEGLAEVAFAGRSNVGKSSLLNALTDQNGLARTSNTPGRTQEVNFFRLGPGGEEMFLVDLPGYGYARVSKSKVKAWTGLIKDYLRGRAQLRRVLVLIDARHGIKENDAEILDMLDEAAVSYQIVLTKIDKLNRIDQEKRLTQTRAQAAKRVACHPIIHATSAEKGWGLDELRADIAALART